MATTKEPTRLRVFKDKVDLGGGKFLPDGIYPGYIEWMHVNIRGKTHTQVGRVMISLSEQQIAAALGEPVNPNRLGMDINVAADLLNGGVTKA